MGMQATKANVNPWVSLATQDTQPDLPAVGQATQQPASSTFEATEPANLPWKEATPSSFQRERSSYASTMPQNNEWKARLEQAMQRLQQTKSVASLRATTPSGGVKIVTPLPQSSSLQDIRHDGANLLESLQGLPLPATQKQALQRSLQALAKEGGNPIQGLLGVTQQLHQTLGHLIQHQPGTQRPGTRTSSTSRTQGSAGVSSTRNVQGGKGATSQSVGETEKVEKKEKSIWEKIGDFFKKAFEVLLKVLDFLSPLLNFIPGIGPALFAAYQGVKLIVSIIKGDINGVIGSLTSMVGGIGGAVSGVAGTVLKMASKIAQASKAMVDAVGSKNPLAVLGALGSVAGGVGGIGKSLGQLGGAAAQAGRTIATAMNHTQQGLQLATAGATVIDGAAKGDVDRVMAGLGSAVQGSSSMVGGTTGQIMRHANQGIQSIYHLSQGRMGAALQGFSGALGQLAQIPEAKKVMKYVQSGLAVAGDLSSGRWNQATQRLLQTVAAHAPGDPQVRKAMQAVQPVLGFVGSLAQSATTQSYHQMQQNWNRVVQQPDFVKAMQWCTEAGKTLERLGRGEPEQLMKQLPSHPLAQQVQEATNSGSWQNGLQAYLQQIQQFLLSPSLPQVASHLHQGKAALHALQQGSWKPAMQQLYSRVPQARNDAMQLQDSLFHAQTFFGGLLSQQFGQALGSLLQQQQGLHNEPMTQDMIHKTATLKTYLSEVASGETYNNLRATQQQLQASIQQAQPWTV
ncbi:MAG: hypothetical protein EP343_17095 [Deltaproteobacteria bacterium]|nr:MAG: hypothetical protein EP343_17095 [Deltaproteobacteria bacterium]